MGLFDAFRFDGKRALVVGGATGMGAAVAELARDAGAEVVVMDYAEIKLSGVKAIQMNLAEKDSIDAAIAECGGPVDAHFACAGVDDGTPGIERINFVGHRYMIDQMRAKGMLPRGSAVGFISSTAGIGWEPHYEQIKPVLDITDFDEAAKWFTDNNQADYMSTKRVMCAYVSREAFTLMKEGIRLNAICPGPTDTPLAQANGDLWLGFGKDYRDALEVGAHTPEQQAYPLLFLCSDAAQAITGITLVADYGWLSSGVTGSFPDATPGALFLLSRMGS